LLEEHSKYSPSYDVDVSRLRQGDQTEHARLLSNLKAAEDSLFAARRECEREHEQIKAFVKRVTTTGATAPEVASDTAVATLKTSANQDGSKKRRTENPPKAQRKAGESTSVFIHRLHRLVDEQSDEVVRWGPNGVEFQIQHAGKLAEASGFHGTAKSFGKKLKDHGFICVRSWWRHQDSLFSKEGDRLGDIVCRRRT